MKIQRLLIVLTLGNLALLIFTLAQMRPADLGMDRETNKKSKDEVVERFDHRFLNREVAPFDRVIPTTENLAIDIWGRLKPHLPDLHGVRVYETDDLYVDYFGETP